MQQKTQSGFWRVVGSVLRLAPPRPRRHSLYYHGVDLEKITAHDALRMDWQAAIGDIVKSAKVELDEPRTREAQLSRPSEATTDNRLLAAK